MKKPKVLIVDDEGDMRIFISTLFAANGYKPVITADAAAGLEKARDMEPDLIVLDVMMPGEEGMKMYQGLKADASLSGIPVILLSAVAPKTFYHYLKMLSSQEGDQVPGPDAYMEKPPDADELLALAGRLIDRSGGHPIP